MKNKFGKAILVGIRAGFGELRGGVRQRRNRLRRNMRQSQLSNHPGRSKRRYHWIDGKCLPRVLSRAGHHQQASYSAGSCVRYLNQAVVTAPAGGIVANTVSLATAYPIAAQIYVHDATGVTIANLTIDGSGNNGLTACGVPNLIGIYYQDATGLINNAVTRNQTSVPPNGCAQGTGMGVFVQSGISLVTGGAGTSTVTVLNSSVHDFQKNGITGNEVGTQLTVTSNEVRGQGPTNGASENGIQLGFGATGKVNANTVIDEIWAPDTSSDSGDAAVGILIFDVADASVLTNHVGNTQFGIAVAGDTTGAADNATITNNTLDGTLIFDGINVCGSSGGTITGNVVSGSTQSGIHLDGTCTGVTSGGTTVTGNTINEACAGILDGTTGNTTRPTRFSTLLTRSSTVTSVPRLPRTRSR